MEPKSKPPDHKVRMTPIDSGNLQRDGTKRTGIDRLSDVVDRLYGPDYRAARRLIHKRLRQKEMGSRGRKPPPPTDESLYQRIMAFRHGKGETPGSSPHPSTGTETPPTSSKQPNRASQRQSPQANKTPERSPPNRTPQRTPPNRTPQRSPQQKAQQRTPPQSSKRAPPQSSRQTPQRTPPAKRAKSPYDRDSSKGSFDSVDLPPLEDDDDDHNPTPKPTKQDRIQSTKEHRRHYRKNPEPEEPATARDVYVEMGDEARDSSSRMSRRSTRQDDLPPVREATPQRPDRPLSRTHSDLNKHTVVPPIKSAEGQRQSRNNTPDQRENSRPSSNRSDKQPSRNNSAQSEKNVWQDRRDDPRNDQPNRAESSRSNKSENKPTSADNRQSSRHNTPTSDDARATVLSPRDRGDSPVGPPASQVPEKPSSSPQDDPIQQDEPVDANRGNPDQRPDANDDAPNNEDDPDSPADSPEPEIPRRTPKVREEDGRIAALDKLADYNLKTLAGQDAGEAPEIDDKMMKEVFSPEFQKELDNFLKT